MTRQIKYAEAIREATDLCMAADPSVYLMGLGVTDPKGVFGTTSGLEAKYGSERVLDMPTSENGMTGVAIGSALLGMRPIMVHQRVDFALLALDQVINNAANWHYMFGGRGHVPLVIRLIIGRGWGQGAQHSQSLQAFFAHIPGLKVVMPSTPYDAKGLLAASVADPNPVVFLEHRWLHNTYGHVPAGAFEVPLGRARLLRTGRDATIAAMSYMTIEALQAAELLARDSIEVDVLDLRTLKPLDTQAVADAVTRTGRLVVADTAWKTGGFAAEVITVACEQAWGALKAAPYRVTSPDAPVPSSSVLAARYYPRALALVNAVRQMLGKTPRTAKELGLEATQAADIPDPSFTGPF